MKKIMAFALTAVMTLALLVGCGDSYCAGVAAKPLFEQLGGIRTEARGVVLSLPVDQVIGLE